MSESVKSYLRPVSIKEKSDSVSDENVIFTNDYEQIFLTDSACLKSQGKGYIILDFGKEICGGIRLLSSYLDGQKKMLTMRFRFGESLSECSAELGEHNALNAHALRDFVLDVPELSDMEIGQTGFRFVRIDFLKDITYLIKSVVAVSYLNNSPLLGSFESDDPQLNQIFDTAARTVHLCMQNMLWDGIKRDRLVWIGDMQPEALALTYLFGENDILEKSIASAVEHNPLPLWFGGIPSYNAWFMQIVLDYYLRTGKRSFVEQYIPYINGVLDQFSGSISEEGHIDYSLARPVRQRGYFIDWPSSQSAHLEEGSRSLLLYVFNNVENTLKDFAINHALVGDLIRRLSQIKNPEILKEKQLLSFQVLSNQVSEIKAYPLLIENGGHGFSTFMSYFIAKAISRNDSEKAKELIKEYYGAMLSLGATSFFEDFDLDWMENAARIDEKAKEGEVDVHATYGKLCYRGYRHSFCHGWSSGPVQFILEEIVGLKILEPGYRKISVHPASSGLKWFNASVPTPKGVIKISYKEGKTDVICPEGIHLVR